MIKNLRQLTRSLFLTILMISIQSNAWSKTEELIKLKQFHSWDVVAKIAKGKKTCHAITVPYKTDVYSGEKGLAVLSVSYMGSNSFSFSINPGIELKTPNGISIVLNGRESALYARRDSAVTYSIVQDIALLNKIIRDVEVIKTRTYGKNGAIIEDFYSINGMKEALLYMNNNCNN